MRATILWFNKAKEYGEAKTDQTQFDERVYVFLSSCTNYVPEPGDIVEIQAKRAKYPMGFVKEGDLYAHQTTLIERPKIN